MPAPPAPIVSATIPNPDPRIGLKAGMWDAQMALWNMRMISTTPPPKGSLGSTHSDLAFTGKYAVQGNYNGFEIWDISNPVKPVLAGAYECPASQNDVSVYRNLLFMSSEATNSRADCKFGGFTEAGPSRDRVRGIRIFDITDVKNPKLVTSVQNCRGSHTHTVLEDPADKQNIYIYISGSSGVRPAEEVPGCVADANDPNTSLFRIEIIKVPLNAPEKSTIVNGAQIFTGLTRAPGNPDRQAHDAADAAARAAARGGGAGAGRAGAGGAAGAAGGAAAGGAVAGGAAAAGATPPPAGAAGAPAAGAGRAGGAGRGGNPNAGPSQCHDITVYPGMGMSDPLCATQFSASVCVPGIL